MVGMAWSPRQSGRREDEAEGEVDGWSAGGVGWGVDPSGRPAVDRPGDWARNFIASCRPSTEDQALFVKFKANRSNSKTADRVLLRSVIAWREERFGFRARVASQQSRAGPLDRRRLPLGLKKHPQARGLSPSPAQAPSNAPLRPGALPAHPRLIKPRTPQRAKARTRAPFPATRPPNPTGPGRSPVWLACLGLSARPAAVPLGPRYTGSACPTRLRSGEAKVAASLFLNSRISETSAEI